MDTSDQMNTHKETYVKKTGELNRAQNRQGDVLLVKRRRLPADATRVETGSGNVVIALGEMTGHKHQFVFQDAEMFRGGSGAQILKVLKDAQLLHEEHAPITFAPGIYDRPIQVEHTDDLEPRIVAD